jgi:hypothetical protein
MEYVEIMRARRVLFWCALVLLAGLVLMAITVYAGHLHAGANAGIGTTQLSSLVGAAAFGAIIVATFLAPGLNAEHTTTAIIWTRPISRDAIAWRYIAVDFTAILAGYALMLAAILGGMALFGVLGAIQADAAQSLILFALGMGGAAMWYALVCVTAARLPGRGGLIAGLSWAVFMIVGGMIVVPLPDLPHYLIVALNYLNPLAWLGDVGSSGVHAHGATHSLIPFDASVRAAGAWAIALVAVVASIRLWSTREA